MKTRIMGAMVAMLIAGVAFAKGKLDGNTYQVTITEPDKKTYADTLSFKNGAFDSTECQKYGFKPAGYAGDGKSFKVTQKSDKEGTAEWTGTIQGDAIEGRFVWSKAGQAPLVYSFTGAARK